MRTRELLDWLGTRLQLDWLEAVVEPPDAPAPRASLGGRLPDAEQLRALDDLVNLGYYRGIVRKLDEIAALHGGHAGFVNHLRGMAHQFQLDAMARVIQQALLDRQTQR